MLAMRYNITVYMYNFIHIYNILLGMVDYYIITLV